jgi:hypothetical protein
MEKKYLYRLISRFLVIALAIFVSDRAIGKMLEYFYFRQSSGAGYLTTYSIDSTKADLMVFGSSRANHSYIPEIFENNLHYSFYNAGRDGTYILHNYALFKAITQRYSPKIVIFDTRPEDLEYLPGEYESLSLLLPYYRTSPEIKKVICQRGPLEKIKNVSMIYKFNSLIFQIASGNLESGKERSRALRGYVPLYGKMAPGTIDTSLTVRPDIDGNKIEALKDIIMTCRQKNIKLIFVYSPSWRIIRKNAYDLAWEKFCASEGINYYNISNLPEFIENPGYFSDIHHLNNEGAKIFSGILSEKIKQNNLSFSGE